MDATAAGALLLLLDTAGAAALAPLWLLSHHMDGAALVLPAHGPVDSPLIFCQDLPHRGDYCHIPGGIMNTREPLPAPGTRLPDEPSRAFAAATLYFKMGPHRSLRAVCRQLYGGSTASRRQIERWSARWGWRERAEQWDDHLETEARQSLIAERREMAQRQARQAQALQTRALQRLADMDVNELSPGDVLRYITEACRLERQALLGHPDLEETRPVKLATGESPEDDIPTIIRLRADDPDFDADELKVREPVAIGT